MRRKLLGLSSWVVLAACGASDEPIAVTFEPEPPGVVVDETETSTDWPTPPLLDVPLVPVMPEITAAPPTPRCLDEGPTCYPIFLAHGLMANPQFLQFYNVADHLRDAGYVVVEGAVEPFDAVEVRGEQLADQIESTVGALGVDKVNVIAHSMGGLDARYAISTRGLGHRVASLTTISTPHRGSAVADTFLAEEATNGDSPIVTGVLVALGTQFSDGLAEDPNLRAALGSLAIAVAPAFNLANPDDPRVVYQSWAGVSTMWGLGRSADDAACDQTFWEDQGENDHLDAIFFGTAPLVGEGGARLPNDGMVTVASARWGQFRGCIRADHADEIGQMADDGPDSNTGFDHLAFYQFLANDIATRGL